jgi:hypothetical protein
MFGTTPGNRAESSSGAMEPKQYGKEQAKAPLASGVSKPLMIDGMIQVLSVLPSAEHRRLIELLLTAREGVEQGMAPDPAKRPSLEQMREFVAEHLS